MTSGAAPVICTNDCLDGSDRLLDLLATGGAAKHRASPPRPGHPEIRRILTHPDCRPAEWLCHLDSDEVPNNGARPVRTPTASACSPLTPPAA